jgi:hypothetical protein
VISLLPPLSPVLQKNFSQLSQGPFLPRRRESEVLSVLFLLPSSTQSFSLNQSLLQGSWPTNTRIKVICLPEPNMCHPDLSSEHLVCGRTGSSSVTKQFQYAMTVSGLLRLAVCTQCATCGDRRGNCRGTCHAK